MNTTMFQSWTVRGKSVENIKVDFEFSGKVSPVVFQSMVRGSSRSVSINGMNQVQIIPKRSKEEHQIYIGYKGMMSCFIKHSMISLIK